MTNKKGPKKEAENSQQVADEKGDRRRNARSYPAWTFEPSLALAEAIQKHASGEKVNRLTLFKAINKSPTSSGSQNLITNSTKYGLTRGSFSAEHLELTAEGKKITSETISKVERARLCFECAINKIAPFRLLYETYKGKKLPAHAIFSDTLKEGYPDIADAKECIDTFVVNCRYLGLLQEIAGTETLVSMEGRLEEIQRESPSFKSLTPQFGKNKPSVSPKSAKIDDEYWNTVCFYVTPIGTEGSIERKHSDLYLSYLVEPAIAKLGLKLVRADQIEQAGLITSHIIEHLLKSRLCVVDLSHHNPNVFYEMALRHAVRLPVVQICRKADKLPFDVNQVRTVVIDDSDIYSLIPKLETYQSEIATQATSALDGDSANPITIFFPSFSMPSGN